MMGHKDRSFAPLCNRSIEDLVPADHFYRYLDARLDLSFVRDWVKDLYAEGGRPSLDPVVFFRLQLIMFFEGLRSERQLVAIATDRLSLRWYLGYDLDEALPDHSSLTRIRGRYGLPIFPRFCERVVALGQAAGLVWGQELFFDATKVQANADLDRMVPRFYWQAKQHVEELFAGDSAASGDRAPEPEGDPEARLGTPPPPEAPAPTQLATGLSPAEEAQLAGENRATWKLLEERRLDPDRPGSGHYQRLSDLRVSLTDPDAALMSDGRKSALGYHDHHVVDGGQARIILSALVTPADVMENTPMLDLLWRGRFRWHLHPRQVVGDTTYGTAENIRTLEEAGIRAYVSLPDWESRTPYYGAARFTYVPERDEYRCPEGHPLRRRKAKFSQRVVVYRAEAATCNACPVKAACTPSPKGRIVSRSFDAEYLDRVRAYHATPAYERAMSKRKVWVEPLFGEAKDWHGLRRFRLRGLAQVNIEGLLVAAGRNLKRLLSRRGWGRRPWPGGAPGHRPGTLGGGL